MIFQTQNEQKLQDMYVPMAEGFKMSMTQLKQMKILMDVHRLRNVDEYTQLRNVLGLTMILERERESAEREERGQCVSYVLLLNDRGIFGMGGKQ